MESFDIRIKARQLMENYKSDLFKIFFCTSIFIALATGVIDLITSNNILIAAIITVLCAPFGYIYISCAFKVIHRSVNKLDLTTEVHEMMQKYREIFSTFFLYELMLGVVTYGIVILFFIFMMFKLSTDISMITSLIETMSSGLGSDTQLYFLANIVVQVIGYIVLMFVVLMVALILYEVNFGLTTFFYYRTGLKGFKALKYTHHAMKGYKVLYFKMYLIYCLKLLGISVLSGLCFIIIPIEIVGTIISSILVVRYFLIEFTIARAVLTEEILIDLNQQENSINDEVVIEQEMNNFEG